MRAVTVMFVVGLSVPLAAQAPMPQASGASALAAVPAAIPLGSRVGEMPTGYDDGGRRDPFASLITPKRTAAMTTGPDGASRPRTGLGGVALADVTVRGVIKSGDTMMAILEAPNKQSFVTRVKDRLLDATVVSVDSDGVVFAEQVEAGMAPSQVRKSLRAAGEGIR
jgi:Tfp pilus assembly protein PilP